MSDNRVFASAYFAFNLSQEQEDSAKWEKTRGQQMYLSKLAKFTIYDHKQKVKKYQAVQQNRCSPFSKRKDGTNPINTYQKTIEKIKREKMFDKLVAMPYQV